MLHLVFRDGRKCSCSRLTAGIELEGAGHMCGIWKTPKQKHATIVPRSEFELLT